MCQTSGHDCTPAIAAQTGNRVGREVENQDDVEDEHSDAIVKEWENTGGRIWLGADAERVESLRKLQAFIGGKKDFKDHASTPLHKLQGIVRQELLGSRLASAQPEGETDD